MLKYCCLMFALVQDLSVVAESLFSVNSMDPMAVQIKANSQKCLGSFGQPFPDGCNYVECVDGYTWTFSVAEGMAEICICDELGQHLAKCAVEPNPTGSVAVPKSLGGCPVTSIGASAFSECNNITNIEIHSNVTKVGDCAFWGCSSLINLTIPVGVTNIGDCAFCFCSKMAEIAIPSGVTRIGKSVFSGCEGLVKVTIPSGVSDIGFGAFDGCSRLEGVTMPSSMTNIGNYAFRGCRSLTSVTIPSCVMNIGYNAFDGCVRLTNVTLPACLSSIACGTFEGCLCLAGIKMPTGLMSIDNNAFAGCCALTDIKLPSDLAYIGENAFKGCTDLIHIKIPMEVACIGVNAFEGCCSLTTIDFMGAPPDGLKSACINPLSVVRYNIAYQAEWLPVIEMCGFTNTSPYDPRDEEPFPDGDYVEYVDGYTWAFSVVDEEAIIGAADDGQRRSAIVLGEPTGTLAVPSTLGRCPVTSIGPSAFYYCSSMTGVTIPSSVTNIDYGAFEGCSGITNLVIPTGVTSIGASAFRGCSGMTQVSISSSVNSIGDSVFAACDNLTTIVVDEANRFYKSVDGCVLSKDGDVLISGTGINVVIPGGVKRIGLGAFGWSGSVTSVKIPPSVTNIGDYAFCDCICLTNVTIPSNIQSVGCLAFRDCCRAFVRKDFGIDFEGAPPDGLASAAIDRDAAIRYNASYADEWTVAISECGFLNAVPYDPQDVNSKLPDLGENPTTEQITNVFVEAKAEDPKLAEKITNETEYIAFREWSEKVQPHGGGDAVGAAGVMAAPNAWVSYALGSETLLETAPTDADLTVEAFEPTTDETKAGQFDFTVSVKDVEVGGAATTEEQKEAVKESLKQVFGLEGGTTLEEGGMSSANVDITFGTPQDGKVKFTAGPKDADAKTFFMKVKVK